MPYIEVKRRNEIENLNYPAETVGELNFEVTRLCNKYLNYKKLSYSTINDIVGVLESAKQEFYRRVAEDYEDEKIKQNGDVYR